jgi:phospholipase/carboxylesterase
LIKIVNGSSLQPLSGQRPKQIVLLLHGYGSNGADLISLAPHWQHSLPEALFLAPNAPQRCGGGVGYQWWPLTALTPLALAAGANSAAPAIDAFIDRKLTQYGLEAEDLALVGFSQGTMMALHVGLRRKTQVAGILGYSGMLTGAADLGHQKITKPPVLLIHGSADPLVPVSALHAAEYALRRVGVDVATHIAPGLGHSVDPVGLRMGADFIARAFNRGATPV